MSFPIQIPRDPYQGQGTRKADRATEMNRMAEIVEAHINDLVSVQKEAYALYLFDEIAADTGTPEKIVRELCRSVGPGLNGVRIGRPTFAQISAMCENRKAPL